MKVAIRTAIKQGRDIGTIICKWYQEVQLVAYVDSDTQKIGNQLEEIPVISLFELMRLYQQGDIDKVIIPCEFYNMDDADRYKIEFFHEELIECGINAEDILISNFKAQNWSKERVNEFGKDFVDYAHFYHLRYLEIPLAFHCNLNCKGCSHFSPLIDKQFPEFRQVEQDFKQLKKLIPQIHRIRLLGGEPLLNKELPRYITMVKSIYPDTDLRIVTNGLLLKQLPEQTLECIRENHVTIDISVYPIMREKFDEWLQWLKQNRIPSRMIHFYEFAPTFTAEKSSYPFPTTDRTCLYAYMTEGTISTCILMHDTKYYNQYFGEELPAEMGLIDLYDPNLTSQLLLEKLKQPYPLCDYCEMYKHMSAELSKMYRQDLDFSWGLCSKENPPQKEDWIYKGE